MKKFKYLLFIAIVFTIGSLKVDAASVSIKSNYTSITRGGYATVIATVSSESPIVSIEGTMTCTGAGANSTISMVFDDMSNSLYSKSYSTTVKGSSVGTISCSVSGVRITNMASASWQYLGNQSVAINVVAPTVAPPKTYSSNNNLSNLSIDGYTLSPAFNKNTLEYSLEVPNEIRKINIKVQKEDNTATVTGIGEVDLIEGINKLVVKVTAENGAVKTYTINVTVKELDPIIVKVDNKEYNVVRKKEQIESPNSTFTETTVKINNFEVPALINKKLNYTLVGLKDSKGKIELYIYNEKDKTNTYTLYQEYKSKSTIICLLDDDSKIPNGYKKTKIKMNNQSVEVYQLSENSKHYLFYGVNVETGKKNLYVYDSVEETIQRFHENEKVNSTNDKTQLYQYIIISLGSLLMITYLVLLICLIRNSSKKKKENMKKISKKEKSKREKEETLEKESKEEEI